MKINEDLNLKSSSCSNLKSFVINSKVKYIETKDVTTFGSEIEHLSTKTTNARRFDRLLS